MTLLDKRQLVRLRLVILLSLAILKIFAEARELKVTSSEDSGPGSLRWAIEQANLTPERDIIELDPNIRSPIRIKLLKPLPPICHPLVINGLIKNLPEPKVGICIDGSNLIEGANGLEIIAPDCEIRAVIIVGFKKGSGKDGAAIFIDNPFGTIVQGCWIGLEPGGNPLGNSIGIYLASGIRHLIGGFNMEDSNIICANYEWGIRVGKIGAYTARNSIQGNFIGTDQGGSPTLGNGGGGILICNSNENIIGSKQSPNIITANSGAGVLISENASYNIVDGNYIGVFPNGPTALANDGPGIFLQGAGPYNYIGKEVGNFICANKSDGIRIGEIYAPVSDTFVLRNYIGIIEGAYRLGNKGNGITIFGNRNCIGNPLNLAFANFIADNEGHGIQVIRGEYNQLIINRFRNNLGLGIKLGDAFIPSPLVIDQFDEDEGPNSLQNAPIIESAWLTEAGLEVSGRLISSPNKNFRVDFYLADSKTSKVNEGELWLGYVDIQTDVSGNAKFKTTLNIPVTDVDRVCATATSTEGNTSEFGMAKEIEIKHGLAPDFYILAQSQPSSIVVEGEIEIFIKVGLSMPEADKIELPEKLECYLKLPTHFRVMDAQAGIIHDQTIWWIINTTNLVKGYSIFHVKLQALAPLPAIFIAGVLDPGPFRKNDQVSFSVNVVEKDAPSISIDTSNWLEGDDPIKIISIPVLLSKPVPYDVTFLYRLEANGNAIPMEDFIPGGGIGVIPAGCTQSWIYVHIVGDTIAEEPEYFTILITDAVGVWISTPAALVWINDDDRGITAVCDLQVETIWTPLPATVGTSLTNQIKIINNGPDVAYQIIITNIVSTNLCLVGTTVSTNLIQWLYDGFLLHIEKLDVAQSVELELVFIATNSFSFTNEVYVGFLNKYPSPLYIDPDLSNNSASELVQIFPSTPSQLVVASDPTFNPQTGLYEQLIWYRNITDKVIAAVKILINGLQPWVSVYNAVGYENGLPYVLINRTVEIGEIVPVLIEFFDPYCLGQIRVNFEAMETHPLSVLPSGGQQIPTVEGRAPLIISSSLIGKSFLIEFRAEPGAQYMILYKDSLTEPWSCALPTIRATANVVQWIDGGPPKTAKSPSEVKTRFYRVLRISDF